jgi:hypothetical protein
MCWSGQASTVLAVFGYSCSFFEFKKMIRYKETLSDTHGLRAIATFYLSLMETLQATNYLYLHTPGKINSLLALLGYVHICFQPFFISLIMLSLIPKARRKLWMRVSMICSTISAIAMSSKLLINDSLPGCFSCHCIPIEHMNQLLDVSIFATRDIGCAQHNFFAYRGNWHIAWQWVLNGCSALSYTYFFTVFILPLFYGAWLVVMSSLLCGPIISIFSSDNPDEFGAIWCLIAITLVASIKIPAWERILAVRHESWRDTMQAGLSLLRKWRASFHINFHLQTKNDKNLQT